MKKTYHIHEDIILMWEIKVFLSIIPKEEVIKKRWMGWTGTIF